MQIFFRETFKYKICPNVQQNRVHFAEISQTVLRRSVFDDGRQEKEWNQGWTNMKRDGLYELDYFADLFIVGML